MGRHTSVVINDELRKKVIDAYTLKGMSITIIAKLTCPRKIAEEILKEAGIEIKHQYNFNNRDRVDRSVTK